MSWKDKLTRVGRFYETPNGILYKGNALDVMKRLPNDFVDLVLTDPPYPKKYAYTYDYLAEECPRIMKAGASLLTLLGHYALLDVIRKFDKRLKYRWIFCMNQEAGSHARMLMGIEVMWKPILWYVKRAYPSGRGFIKDMLTISREDGIKKRYHKWQQSEQWAEFFIQKLSNEGDIVLDPYFGSGTVGVVCERLGRRWIGIEIDESCCEVCVERFRDNHVDSILFGGGIKC